MTVRSTTGQVSERTVSTKMCDICGGTGKVPHAGSVQERIYEMGQAKTRYDGIQRARKFAAVGETWVPEEVAKALAVKQSVALKSAAAAPCKECSGIGRTQCRRCTGKGRMPCTNSDCKKGKVSVTKRGALSKFDMKQSTDCPTCKGTATLDCPACEGKGSVLCQVCNGTGEREVCSRCDGRGFEPCRYCKGTGSDKGKPCSFCKADGLVECTACRGDGRK
jgi:DnaJ-class molecular chaperone